MMDTDRNLSKILQLFVTIFWISTCVPYSHSDNRLTKPFQKIALSVNGFEYLESPASNETTTRTIMYTRDTCEALCLRTTLCTGYVFDEGAGKCRLIHEFCGGSEFQPKIGELYSKKGSCPIGKDYQLVDIGVDCQLCVWVSGEQDPPLTYENARRACQNSAADLLHWESLDDYDLTRLGDYFILSYSKNDTSFWVGINSLFSKDHETLQWDNTRIDLVESEVTSLDWDYQEPTNISARNCVYFKNYLTTFALAKCSETFGYICMLDI